MEVGIKKSEKLALFSLVSFQGFLRLLWINGRSNSVKGRKMIYKLLVCYIIYYLLWFFMCLGIYEFFSNNDDVDDYYGYTSMMIAAVTTAVK